MDHHAAYYTSTQYRPTRRCCDTSATFQTDVQYSRQLLATIVTQNTDGSGNSNWTPEMPKHFIKKKK